MIAPIVAAGRSDVAFVVMLAGPGRRGDDVLLAQNLDLSAAAGAPPAALAAIEQRLRTIYPIVEASADLSQATAGVQAAITAGKLPAGDYSALVTALSTPWMRGLLSFDPAAYLPKVKCPVLALIGRRIFRSPRVKTFRRFKPRSPAIRTCK